MQSAAGHCGDVARRPTLERTIKVGFLCVESGIQGIDASEDLAIVGLSVAEQIALVVQAHAKTLQDGRTAQCELTVAVSPEIGLDQPEREDVRCCLRSPLGFPVGDGSGYPSRRNRAVLHRTVRVSCSAIR
jgi:hypothetical protein